MSCKKCRHYDREERLCREFKISISSTTNAKVCSKYSVKNKFKTKMKKA